MSLFKHFRIFETQYLEFRADGFNVLNTPIYGIPANLGGASNPDISQQGGLITSARSLQNYTPNGRFFQLSAKYVF